MFVIVVCFINVGPMTLHEFTGDFVFFFFGIQPISYSFIAYHSMHAEWWIRFRVCFVTGWRTKCGSVCAVCQWVFDHFCTCFVSIYCCCRAYANEQDCNHEFCVPTFASNDTTHTHNWASCPNFDLTWALYRWLWHITRNELIVNNTNMKKQKKNYIYLWRKNRPFLFNSRIDESMPRHAHAVAEMNKKKRNKRKVFVLWVSVCVCVRELLV